METKKKRPWLWYALAVVLVAADQLVKLWVRHSMELGETREFIPHFLELFHVENTGAAFSILSGQTWILTALSAVVTVGLTVCLWRGYAVTNRFSRLCVTFVLAGAAGNLIDRAAFGTVTDMFNFTFIRFGVFNVADMWVVGGVIGYCAYLIYTQVQESRAAKAGGGEPTDEAGH